MMHWKAYHLVFLMWHLMGGKGNGIQFKNRLEACGRGGGGWLDTVLV